jgi:hypothetical protein
MLPAQTWLPALSTGMRRLRATVLVPFGPERIAPFRAHVAVDEAPEAVR